MCNNYLLHQEGIFYANSDSKRQPSSPGQHRCYGRGGAFYEYQQSFLNYLHLEDMGIFTAYGKENKSEETLAKLREAGRKLK